METIITNKFGSKEIGSNHIVAYCFKSIHDMHIGNSNVAQITDIGFGYMNDEQMLILLGDAEIFPNEDGGLTYLVKKVMPVKEFRKAFMEMCRELDKRKSVIW